MKAVIDTNVLLVADEKHGDTSASCVSHCVKRLLELQASGCVVIDDNYHLIGEYQNNINANQGKGMGATFLKWLLQNQANLKHVERVSITETDENHFEEFPNLKLEPEFDAPDRKFVSVANAHPEQPPIWQATDCKWLDWWPALRNFGISVDFLCPEVVLRFYQAEYPDRDVPALP